jgi:hypothetical protein
MKLHVPADAGLARAAAALFAGLLVVRDALDVLGETFFLTQFLEAAEHLLGRLIAATLDLNHVNPFCSFRCTRFYVDTKTTGNDKASCGGLKSVPEGADSSRVAQAEMERGLI